MQTKLTEREIQKLIERKDSLEWMMKSIADQLETASRAVAEVNNRIEQMVRYKTSDGKPYIEPEPPIPEGWRRANADEWRRKDVKFWSVNNLQWNDRPAQGSKFDAPIHGTRYIVPIDPPLTDQDACVWPRLLVMVRDKDCHIWEGPCTYVGKDDDTTWPFVVFFPGRGSMVYAQARRATPEEIEAAK